MSPNIIPISKVICIFHEKKKVSYMYIIPISKLMFKYCQFKNLNYNSPISTLHTTEETKRSNTCGDQIKILKKTYMGQLRYL